MVMNHMVQFVKQLSTKLSPSMYSSTMQQSEAEGLARLRQIQRELKNDDALDQPLHSVPFIVFDLETSGFFPDKGDEILSIGAIKMNGVEIFEEKKFYSTVQCKKEPSGDVLSLTGLTLEELASSNPLPEVLHDFYDFVGGGTLVAHHATHEKRFMSHMTWQLMRMPFAHRIIDTTFLTRVVASDEPLVTLDECCEYYNIPITTRHHALHDAEMTAKLWQECLMRAQEKGFSTLRDIYIYLATLKK
ncbi:3'-5' exonuclease [Alkalihalophilus lindianensis]|uniref:3'-5' exonuclease n=1 Tax=Alkalihalophilus lindianensis TaxID=1630542 RepID=A0ABU3X9N2_9BACI|nr:3'-5' exonuclease [Alkalihalophilus lindianensis]MDV2684593.1 3'-5' exonuclease [Alkalihalophilus lindianensis]